MRAAAADRSPCPLRDERSRPLAEPAGLTPSPPAPPSLHLTSSISPASPAPVVPSAPGQLELVARRSLHVSPRPRPACCRSATPSSTRPGRSRGAEARRRIELASPPLVVPAPLPQSYSGRWLPPQQRLSCPWLFCSNSPVPNELTPSSSQRRPAGSILPFDALLIPAPLPDLHAAPRAPGDGFSLELLHQRAPRPVPRPQLQHLLGSRIGHAPRPSRRHGQQTRQHDLGRPLGSNEQRPTSACELLSGCWAFAGRPAGVRASYCSSLELCGALTLPCCALPAVERRHDPLLERQRQRVRRQLPRHWQGRLGARGRRLAAQPVR